MKNLVLICFLWSICSTLKADVVVNSNISLASTPAAFFGDYQITISQKQNPIPSDITYFWFDHDTSSFPSGENYKYLTNPATSLDEGSDWYLATSGQIFTKQTITSNNFPLFLKGDHTGFTTSPILVGSGTFYLAFTTGLGFDLNNDPNRSIFGWAQFQNTGTEIKLLSSAITYDTQGIVVGSIITVPEPASVALVFVAISATIFVRNRFNKHRSKQSQRRLSC
jgi:hypothetical protein